MSRAMRGVVAAGIGLLALQLPAAAASGAVRAQGVYSNIAMTASEDYQGMEVIISLTDRGYYAVLQCASGADATRPLVLPVQVDESAGRLVIAAHDDPDNSCPAGTLSGRFDRQGLHLHDSDGNDLGLLPRGRSFWQ